MLPAYNDVLTIKNFKEIAKVDEAYANLLASEFDYCMKHEDDILKKASSVYKIGCNKQHKLNYTCCDFKKLEKNYMSYKK